MANGKSQIALVILDNGSDILCIIQCAASEMGFNYRSQGIKMRTVSEKDEKVMVDICHIELQSLHDKGFSVAMDGIMVDQILMDVELAPFK